jgi:hypothetical protein
MQLKQACFDVESVQLFGFEKSRERPHTKNVHEASVLHFGWGGAVENRRREITSSKQKGETAFAISPNIAFNV